MRSLTLLLLTIFLCVCCSRSDSQRNAEIVEYWQGREITLPDGITDILTGDTFDLADADFTILTYVDSTGCTGCKMKLPIWKEFLNSIDSVSDSDVRFLMAVNTSDLKELLYLLKSNAFHYPVYLDSGNVVYEANKFPEETTFRTFLLDRNKKVVAIGSPVYSEEIGRLYKSIISGRMSFSPGKGNAITVSENMVNLGNLHPGDTKKHAVLFTNTGRDTVRIVKTVSSCDCTEISFSREILPPRSQVKATLVFRGDSISGEFERSIHVYYKDFEYPTIINVSGNIQ